MTDTPRRSWKHAGHPLARKAGGDIADEDALAATAALTKSAQMRAAESAKAVKALFEPQEVVDTPTRVDRLAEAMHRSVNNMPGAKGYEVVVHWGRFAGNRDLGLLKPQEARELVVALIEAANEADRLNAEGQA
jgi:hypothetical protein